VQDPNLATLVSNPALTAAVVQLASMATHAFTGLASAHGLEVLKSVPWFGSKWTKMSTTGKVLCGGVLAFCASLGVTGAFNYDSTHSGGVLVITLAGISATSIGSHVWGLMQSWSAQQFTYNVAIQPKTVTGSVPLAGAPPPVPLPVVVAPAPPLPYAGGH
jgi:hypothetical protein